VSVKQLEIMKTLVCAEIARLRVHVAGSRNERKADLQSQVYELEDLLESINDELEGF
jgi:hypothetical protein